MRVSSFELQYTSAQSLKRDVYVCDKSEAAVFIGLYPVLPSQPCNTCKDQPRQSCLGRAYKT